jgi:hypothetical protein
MTDSLPGELERPVLDRGREVPRIPRGWRAALVVSLGIAYAFLMYLALRLAPQFREIFETLSMKTGDLPLLTQVTLSACGVLASLKWILGVLFLALAVLAAAGPLDRHLKKQAVASLVLVNLTALLAWSLHWPLTAIQGKLAG